MFQEVGIAEYNVVSAGSIGSGVVALWNFDAIAIEVKGHKFNMFISIAPEGIFNWNWNYNCKT